MYPNQPQQNGYQPQPQQPLTPVGPTGFQQTPSGQYAVLPPLNNAGGASGHNPYEFIMQPNSKTHGWNLGNASFGKQIALIAGGAILLIIIMAIAFSAFTPKGNTQDLLAVAQRQQEIIRIADNASRNLQDQNVSNFVTNTDMTVITDQNSMLTYLKSHAHLKPKSKTLALDHDAKTDALLDSAKAAGTYDTAVAQELQSQLTKYESELQTAYKQSTGTRAKQLLQKSFTNADALLKQAQSVTSSSNSN